MESRSLDRLIDRLVVKTESGEIRWKEGARANTYQVSFPDYSITVEGVWRPEIASPNKFSLRVLDSKGEIAISAIGGFTIGLPDDEAAREIVDGAKLMRLFAAARKSVFATRDKAVEALLARLA